MLRNGLFMLLGALLVLLGGLLLPDAVSQWSNSSVEETILDRVICRQLVVVDDIKDYKREFKGTLVDPTKVAIHRPGRGSALYSYDSAKIGGKEVVLKP